MNVTQAKQLPGGAWISILSLSFLIAVTVAVVACSSGNGSTSSTPPPTSGASKVNVRISDPATCQSPSGPYSHVFVTITDVQANVTSTAAITTVGGQIYRPVFPRPPCRSICWGRPIISVSLPLLAIPSSCRPAAIGRSGSSSLTTAPRWPTTPATDRQTASCWRPILVSMS